MNRWVRTTLITTALCPAAALAQFDFDDPDRWSLVTSRDNIPYGGGPGGELAGSGSVPYDFRISQIG
ncbi:MAG: hypothetical protein ACF8LL_06630, partial [Phycisphaerales bacterium]